MVLLLMNPYGVSCSPQGRVPMTTNTESVVSQLETPAELTATESASVEENQMLRHVMAQLWYCLRWGLVLPTKKPRECAWKKLYFKRDADDMVEFVKNCPTELKEYYIQMQAAKRSQVPLPSLINDEHMILDKTVADQVSIWKNSKGLGDNVVNGHACSGETCAYHQIGDVFVCEKTGNVHVCDDACREVVLDPTNGLLLCTISGHCFDSMLLSPDEMEPDVDQQQAGMTDEAEPFMGSGLFGSFHLELEVSNSSFLNMERLGRKHFTPLLAYLSSTLGLHRWDYIDFVVVVVVSIYEFSRYLRRMGGGKDKYAQYPPGGQHPPGGQYPPGGQFPSGGQYPLGQYDPAP
ncbi:hypothetical protein H5410_039748 [Solanum commersonii]|uniref:Uncharacterized protein n=1 Tax=Solanum commersonii TaxID=4109 RepID=A0A9J5XN38_SOLCO|nr:hypothetical protein H5410_039748 [Solanum commersonii]